MDQAGEPPRNVDERMMERRKMETIGLLASGMAHEFNNLLMTILGNADMARFHLSEVSPARPMLLEIEQASKRAADLCRQLLSYAAKGPLAMAPARLNPLIEAMNGLLGARLSRRVTLRLNLDGGVPPIQADANQVKQLVLELVLLAAEAIGERPGTIALTTGAMNCDAGYLAELKDGTSLTPGRYVYLEVSDTGAGMDREAIRRLLDPEPRFESAADCEPGLEVIREIVHGHGGAIKVYSEPGRGTTIKLLFPAMAEAQTRAPGNEPGWQGRGGTVLVVDDEAHVRQVAGEMLRLSGFKVLTAASGEEAVPLYREHAGEVVCVLMDMTMPGVGGVETFRELRRVNGDVRVILSSGYNEQDVVDRFAGKGLAGFIQKPYMLKTLLEAVRRAIEG